MVVTGHTMEVSKERIKKVEMADQYINQETNLYKTTNDCLNIMSVFKFNSFSGYNKPIYRFCFKHLVIQKQHFDCIIKSFGIFKHSDNL